MKERRKHTGLAVVIAAVGFTLIGSVAHARDGSWPVRFAKANDGAWPVKFEGQSRDMAASSLSLQTKLVVDSINEDSLAGLASRSFDCQSTAQVEKHRATGKIIIDGAEHQIVGACFIASEDKVEIVAKSSDGSAITSYLVGNIPEEASRRFAARLKLQGDQQGRYRFDGSWPLGRRPL